MDGEGTRNLLTVEEAGVRPRANSDPTVNAGGLLLPEIRVEDCTEPELLQHLPATTLPFGEDDPPRRRSNTCPEDLFRKRNGRPPTPPPSTFRKGHKFRSGFAKPVMKKESVSFAHHRLSKLAESEDADDAHRMTEAEGDEEPQMTSSVARRPGETEVDAGRLPSQLDSLHLGSGGQFAKKDSYPPSSTLPGKASSDDVAPCSSHCGPGSRGSATDSSLHQNGCAVSDAPEDSFLSQSQSAKCRCAQTSTSSAVDSKQLQAC